MATVVTEAGMGRGSRPIASWYPLSPGPTKPALVLLCCVGTWLVICSLSFGAPTPENVKLILELLKFESKELYENYVSALETAFLNHFSKMFSFAQLFFLSSYGSQRGDKSEFGWGGMLTRGKCTSTRDKDKDRLVQGPKTQQLPRLYRTGAHSILNLKPVWLTVLLSKHSCWKCIPRDGAA